MPLAIEGLEVVGVYRRCDGCGQVKPLQHFTTRFVPDRVTGELTIREPGRSCAACRVLSSRLDRGECDR